MRRAVIADIHGNLPALEAVMADMAVRRVDTVVNLGDCVSGPLWPRETLALLRECAWPTIRGNHDRWVGEAAQPDQLDASDRYAHEQITADDRAWLGQCDPIVDLGDGVVAMHARPDDDNAYLLETQSGDRLLRADAATVRARLGALDGALVLTAHSHLQAFLKLPDGPWVLNPGSVGCPAYDDDATEPPHISEQGSPEARYAIVETRAEGFVFELLSIPYDLAIAEARAVANGRPEWAHALRTGFARRGGSSA